MLAARQLDRLNESAEEMRGYGVPALAVQTDVTSEEQVMRLFETTMEEYGRLDILVNNSGAFDGGPIDEIPLDTWMKVINVNLTGVFLCTREAMKIMKRQKSGRIINIGSISSRMPRMNSAPYTTSKHGIIGLTKSTALEGREYGIAAGALHPGKRRGGVEGGQHPALGPGADDDAGRHSDRGTGDGAAAPVRQHARYDRAAGWAALRGAGVGKQDPLETWMTQTYGHPLEVWEEAPYSQGMSNILGARSVIHTVLAGLERAAGSLSAIGSFVPGRG